MSKPRFSIKATAIVLFFISHLVFEVLISQSVPFLLILPLLIYLLVGYVLIGIAAFLYFIKILKKAIQEVRTDGFDKDTKQAFIIILVMTVLAIIFIK